MKKLFTFVMLAVMLLAVSCNKPEEKAENLGNKAQITFKVSTEDVLTKAVSYGDGTLAGAAATGELLVQAFILGSDSKYTLMPDAQITISDPNNGEWDVDLQLAKGETYKIAFWAQKKGTGIYNTENLSAVTVDYSKFAINSDDADAFCAAREIKVEGALSETVELKRPLAQLNIGTRDRTIYNNSVTADKKDITAKITLPVGVPSKLNVIGGTAAEGVVPATVTDYTTETNVFTGAAMSGETLGDYDYLTMLYVLADPAKATMDFSAELSNAANKLATLVVSNMPYQANYRTNIVGQLLTGNIHYDVIIVPGFETPDYEKQIAPGFGSVAALNDYFETMADNSDNGDVEPEEVSVSAVADGDIIKLPKIAGGVVIRVNAVCDGTLTVQYADGASDTQKPANVYLYVKKATNLVVNLPASHVELIDDSWVTGTITATTSGDTFVVGGKAKVGKVEIKQGNSEIAGEVNQVVVAEDASADGEGAPVEVFLAKESAVKQIELNAKADVVVEQPKDNIDASTTENKVEVVVKEAAAGSTATAQNGGDIYVKAYGECSIIADGADEDDNANKSNVTVAEATAEVTATSLDEGVIVVKDAAEENVDVLENGVAMTGGKIYETLQAAVDACVDGGSIDILKDINLTTVSTTLNGEASVKYNVIIQDKGLTLNGNNHSITASTGKRPLALAGNGKSITVKDLTINAKGGTALWLTANNMVATLDHVIVDGTNCTESYNQVVTIGSGFTGIEFNVTNGSVIKTNDEGSVHYTIIAWSPATINVSNSTLKGWSNIYLKPAASGSVVNVSNSKMQSKGQPGGSWNNFGLISVEGANNTITLDNVDAHSTSSGDTYNTLINVSQYWASQSGANAFPNKIYILNDTSLEGDGTAYSGLLIGTQWALFAPGQNVFYFDEGTKAGFEQYFPEDAVVNGPESGLYSVSYIPQAFYYWSIGENQYQGSYCDFDAPFTKGWLMDGEFIDLMKDITLTADINCALTEGESFFLNFGEFSITKGNYSVKLPAGVSVVTDKQTDIFTAADSGAEIVETAGESTFTYTVKAPMDYNTFNALLHAAGGVWTEEASVVLKESQRNIFNNGGAQFYLGRTDANINGTEGDITIKNVTFTYDADDDSVNYDMFGELQIPLNGNLTFEDCTFIGVSVSPWSTLGGAQTDFPQKALFKNCTFQDEINRYGVHQNKAKTLVVTGCTFTNCKRGIHTNCPAPVKFEIKNNTFSGIDDTKGVLCLAEGNVVDAQTVFDVTGNVATGQKFLRQLCSTVTLAQLNALLDGNTYAEDAYTSDSIIPAE